MVVLGCVYVIIRDVIYSDSLVDWGLSRAIVESSLIFFFGNCGLSNKTKMQKNVIRRILTENI